MIPNATTDRRAYLIYKKHFGAPLTRAERSELRKLSKAEDKRLAREMAPWLRFARELLRTTFSK